MDAFFASVEQLDNPDLRGKPVAVGRRGERHVVAAASYEARKFGVRSAMPSVIAEKLCPGLIFVRHRFDRYNEISEKVFDIFREYTDLVEPLSIDEAFLDVTEGRKEIYSATLIAREIKEEIKTRTGLTASAGVSFNKFLAKIASDINKPDGIFIIRPEEAGRFVEELPVERFYGIGKATSGKMHRLGIHNGADLKKWELPALMRNFGKAGLFYFDIARGTDNRPVVPSHVRKSIGTEITYEKDLTTGFGIIAELYKVEKELMERLEASGTTGRTITMKVRFHDFSMITRSRSLPCYISDFKTLHREVTVIRKSLGLEGKRIRLFGLTVSNLEGEQHDDTQLDLFGEGRTGI